MGRRWLMNLAAVTVIAVMLSGFVALAPRAGAGTWYYAQWNLWGNKGNHGNNLPAQKLVEYVGAQGQLGRAPASISLQEVCRSSNPTYSQFDYLLTHLGAFGYYGMYAQTS